MHNSEPLVVDPDLDTRSGIPRVLDETADATPGLGQPSSAGTRFRVLRPHARGGIGTVSVALDAELNREVALKQILPDQADNLASRAGFLLEAEVTARLEHPGVVPVYGLGMSKDARPFYAMRLVRGDTLKEAVESSPSRQRRPGATPANTHWPCATCSLDFRACATLSRTPTAGA